jgi:hypothetical protein
MRIMARKLFAPILLAVFLVTAASPLATGGVRAAAPDVPLVGSTHIGPHLFEKTRFVLYVGIAAYCIHYVYKHYQYGDYSSGASHRITNIAKAAAALLIAYNRLKAAAGVAHKSNSKTLHTLVAPLDRLVAHTDTEYQRLHSGKFNGSDVATLYKDSSTFLSLAGNSGYAIREVATGIP